MVGLHDTGEELMLKATFRTDQYTRPAAVSVGLYNDTTDALSDSGDVGDITTEPAGAAYARQTATLDGSEFALSDSSGDWQSVIADQTFDTSDSSQSIDSYFVVVSFMSDDKGDGSATDHLFFTGSLDATYDLANVDSFTLSGAGIKLN